MKRRLRVWVTPDAAQGPGDRVMVSWTGRLGRAQPDQEAQVATEPVFGPRRRRGGKGVTAKGRGTKAGGPAPELLAGKGRTPKGVGPKGGSLAMVPVTLRVPPVTGLRTFEAATFDVAGNESSGNPELTAMISIAPPQPGPAAFDDYDSGTDVVTIRTPDRMY